MKDAMKKDSRMMKYKILHWKDMELITMFGLAETIRR
jgi:hypothetical protein